MKARRLILVLTLLGGAAATWQIAHGAQDVDPNSNAQVDPAWPWGDEHDAVAAAPDSHRVLLENDRVRVLEVIIRPGEREPPHTHRWPSVMTVTEKARIRYYDADGELRFETPPRSGEATAELGADWLRPEGLHSVENIDLRPFRALRVELKEAAGP